MTLAVLFAKGIAHFLRKWVPVLCTVLLVLFFVERVFTPTLLSEVVGALNRLRQPETKDPPVVRNAVWVHCTLPFWLLAAVPVVRVRWLVLRVTLLLDWLVTGYPPA